MAGEEVPNGLGCGGRPVTFECCIHPAFGEEDVSCTLNLAQQLKAGKDELLRVLLPQWVMQVTERFHHPGFPAPVGNIPETVKRLHSHRWVGRNGGHYKRQPRLPVGVLSAS